MADTATLTLGDIVAADFRAAAVLERFGLDFCCGGKRTLDEACDQRHLDPAVVMGALEALGSPTDDEEAPTAAWPLDRLIDYIVTRHHAYVRESLPVITAHIRKIVTVHGETHPELARVERGFASLAQELTVHMLKEEQILFPYVRALATAERAGRHIGEGPFGTVQNPIRMMEAEHQSAGNELRGLRDLTAGYTVPENGCATYRACFDELREFESDLQRHIHLENNILFPAAIDLEQRLS